MTAIRVIDKHSEFTELDYASAGHIGFASSADLTTVSGTLQTDIDTKLESIIEDIDPEIGGDLACGGYDLNNVGKVCTYSFAIDVCNNTGATLIQGTAVTVCGLSEERCCVCISDNRETIKMPCGGIIYADIADGENGCLIRVGRVKMNTSGMTGVVGDRLYVQNDGSLDTVIPTNGMVQRVGILTVKAAGNAGRICVCPRGPRSMYSAKDQHPIIRMGDDAGHQKAVFRDYDDNDIGAIDSNGNLTVSGTVDGVDIDGFKSDFDFHDHDDRYYTETEIDTISGTLNIKIDGKGDVTAAANITDNRITRGDGGAKGIQESTIAVSDDGEMTNLNQPAFLVHPTTNQTNIAVGSNITVIFGTEVFDQGNNFASNIFTAPVTGKYQLNTTIRLMHLDIDTSVFWVAIQTSNACYYNHFDVKYTGDPVEFALSCSVLADMDANDTSSVRYLQTGGAAQVDIGTLTYFSGALIC